MSTPANARPTITLTPKEASLRQALVDAAAFIDENIPPSSPSSSAPCSNEPLTLRFTGGWVRDKLLAGESVDIDVGINKMTGYDFATSLGEYLTNNTLKYPFAKAHGLHKIAMNPEKSKHLETTTTKLYGLDLDFVNLRSESYSDATGRIPEVQFGTPEQDALRRDACVNALFYNLHTQEVEDFTGRGLQDLRDKVIRTPLAPYETFYDDPLRVLRLIRFASRLGFTIVDEAKDAMRNGEIQNALRTKISRERVGTELEKMLKGRDPKGSLALINELGLWACIFTPPALDLPRLPLEINEIAVDIVANLSGLPLGEKLMGTPNERYLAWILAALTPWENKTLPGKDKANKTVLIAATAAREGFKADNKISATVANAFRNYNAVQAFLLQNAATAKTRSEIGMYLRHLGLDWKSQLLLSLLMEAILVWTAGNAQGVLDRYDTFLNRVAELKLNDVNTLKPVLDGKRMMAVLGAEKPGPWMKGALRKLVEWQLAFDVPDEMEAERWVGERRAELMK